jgi:hypothetical protein
MVPELAAHAFGRKHKRGLRPAAAFAGLQLVAIALVRPEARR